MISYLRGKIISKSSQLKKTSFVVVDVNGIGYQVSMLSKAIAKLPLDAEAEIYVHTNVREDAIELFGFLLPEETNFFKLLNTITGIGPRTALNILERVDIKNIQQAVIQNEPKLLCGKDGLGQKTAERIVNGLKNCLEEMVKIKETEGQSSDLEVIDALMSLGFSHDQARSALGHLSPGLKTSEEKVKEALKILGSKK